VQPRGRDRCFDHVGPGDGQAYGRLAAAGRVEPCEDDALEQLVEMRRRRRARRGIGAPVACEVARALHAPLEIVIVRKLGMPGQEELGDGHDRHTGAVILNDDLVRRPA
jgi:hypothetical protein